MSHAYVYHTFVLYEVPNLTGKVILDIGCGKGLWGYLMKCEKQGDKAYCIGLDISIDYLKFVKRHNIYDDLILADASNLPFRAKSFDIVIASEIIEHLQRDKGFKLLNEIDAICKGKAIITTPNGFLPSRHEKCSFEYHKSGWRAKDFRSYHYKVRGIGFKYVNLYTAFKRPRCHGF
ncbi:MAG: class I SAM-dependent methyltransferase, partial [Candidatus Bathyarchaeia archaeon]